MITSPSKQAILLVFAFCVALSCLFIFTDTAYAEATPIIYPTTSPEEPICCQVKYDPGFLKPGFNPPALNGWVESSGFFPGCTANNTSYQNTTNNQYYTDSTHVFTSCPPANTSCKTPYYLETNYTGTLGPGVIDPGGFSIIGYYSSGTKIYGKYMSDFRDANNPIDTTNVADNKTAPDLCLAELQEQNIEGGPCAYKVCDVNGYWRDPLSEDFTETCPLNKLFQFEVEGPTSTGLQTTGIDTAIGCFPSTPEGIVTAILRVLMGISGLLALVIIVASIVTIMTSADNPEKVKESYSKITYAAIGLVLIILSVFILRFIGINILNLSNFLAYS